MAARVRPNAIRPISTARRATFSGKDGRKMDENETTGERVTEWMDPWGFCGHTGYGANVRTNYKWCKCEVERLAAKGLRAGIETNEEGLIAVAIFR